MFLHDCFTEAYILLKPTDIWNIYYEPIAREVTVQWHEVEEAEYYNVFISIVPLGEPAGDYFMVQSVDGLAYQHFVTEFNVTEYYYVITRSATGAGFPSNTMSIDITEDS
jgi:hypothetical protein